MPYQLFLLFEYRITQYWNMNLRRIFIIASILAVVAVSQSFPPNNVQSLFWQQLNPQKCCTDQTIKVFGQSTIQADPDTASLSAQVSANGASVNEAVALLAKKVSSVIGILTSSGLSSTNYQTSSLNIYANTSFSNGVSTVIGQIATQSFAITIPIISADASNIGKLIDNLATINGIVLNGLSFDVKNKTDQLNLARSKAFSNAKNKATDYTSLLQISLGQLLSVKDNYSSAPITQPLKAQPLMLRSSQISTPTQVNLGKIDISYSVEIVYAFA